MARYYFVHSVQELYQKVGKDLLKYGESVNPRGMETIELNNVMIEMKFPNNNLVYHNDRKFSLIYGVTESLLLGLPNNELIYYSKINPNIKNYSDDEEHLQGSYGYRIADSIKDVVNILKNDMNTRQAVLDIHMNHDTRLSSINGSKDIPCTLNLIFSIRNNKLNLTINMRSNDIIYGLPYDIFMFTNLQQVIANELKIKTGRYIHNVVSLHVYKNMLDKLYMMISPNTSNFICNVNMNLEQYLKASNAYKNIIDNTLNTEHLHVLDTFNSLIMRELIYKGEYDKSYLKYCNKVPEWAKPFVTRWESEGINLSKL